MNFQKLILARSQAAVAPQLRAKFSLKNHAFQDKNKQISSISFRRHTMATVQTAPGSILPPKMMDDMKFVGMFQIIIGALACLSIFGAITGVPMLISGLRARESADAFVNYQRDNDANWLARAFTGQAGFFKMQKIVAILTIVMMALLMVFYGVVIAVLVRNGVMRHSLPTA
jgi:hypothetical protein